MGMKSISQVYHYLKKIFGKLQKVYSKIILKWMFLVQLSKNYMQKFNAFKSICSKSSTNHCLFMQVLSQIKWI